MATEENITGTEAGNQVIGQVVILYGNVKAISPDGTERIIALNNPIFANDRIITESDGRVSIVIDATQAQIDLGRMSDVVIDEDAEGEGESGKGDDVQTDTEGVEDGAAGEDGGGDGDRGGESGSDAEGESEAKEHGDGAVEEGACRGAEAFVRLIGAEDEDFRAGGF